MPDCPDGPECGACAVEEYVERRLREEGCRVADFDVVSASSRLCRLGYSWQQVAAGEVPGIEFWRAVYGPAYPAAVEPKPFDASDPSTYARTISIDGMSPDEYFATDPAR